MKIVLELNIKNSENIGYTLDAKEIERIKEIFEVLIEKGAVTGIRGGQTILSFDGNGIFMDVKVNYSPWHRHRHKVDY